MHYGVFEMHRREHVKHIIVHVQLSPWGRTHEVRNMRGTTEIKYQLENCTFRCFVLLYKL